MFKMAPTGGFLLELRPLHVDLSQYDTAIPGTPVWRCAFALAKGCCVDLPRANGTPTPQEDAAQIIRDTLADPLNRRAEVLCQSVGSSLGPVPVRTVYFLCNSRFDGKESEETFPSAE